MRKKIANEVLMGSAVLQKDSFSQNLYWTSWDGEGNNEVSFSAGQALVIPTEHLPIGTEVFLLPPKEPI